MPDERCLCGHHHADHVCRTLAGPAPCMRCPCCDYEQDLSDINLILALEYD